MKTKLILTCLLVIILLHSSLVQAQITVTANTDSIGRYDVFELTIAHPVTYGNNWEDVSVKAIFTGSETIDISGFFYNNYTWKVRFAPPQTGHWKYQVIFSTPSETYKYDSNFTCIPSTTKGFLRKHPTDPFRLIYADGTLFNGVGFGDCFHSVNQTETPLDDFGFEGGVRTPNYTGSDASVDVYMKAYGSSGAGFNLFRWSIDNCSFRLYNSITASGNSYYIENGIWGDSLVQFLRKNNIRSWITFFNYPLFREMNGNMPLEEAALKRYINYVVARYGAYCDIWELFNENSATDYWINTVVNYLRSIDPYQRLVSVSDQRPDLAAIDINSPHWYEKESELASDVRSWDMITSRKSWNKPVIFGEQGNSGQNWDPLSATRMRLRSWTAFFAEGMFIFWNTSFAKDFESNSANIYLGPEERGYTRAMQDFTAHADSAIRPMVIEPSNSRQVRGYGLRSPKTIMAYFHHFESHDNSVTTSFNYRMRNSGTIYWINPADNSMIKTGLLKRGTQTISSPSFNIDLAMRIDIDSIPSPIDASGDLDILVYPNPATTTFTVEGNFIQPAVVELFDAMGRRVFMKGNIHNNEKVTLPGIAKGTYMYRMSADVRQTSGKLVIE